MMYIATVAIKSRIHPFIYRTNATIAAPTAKTVIIFTPSLTPAPVVPEEGELALDPVPLVVLVELT